MNEDAMDEEGGEAKGFTVTMDQAGTRIDRALADLVGGDLSRSRLKNLIMEGQLLLNGVPCIDPSRKVAGGEELSLVIPPLEDALPQPENIPLSIVYEDEHLLVIDKAAGMVVHPGAGNPDGTLVSALLYHCGDELSGIGGVKRPGIVHRLDKETTGLMIVAKNDRAHQGLSAQLSDRSLSRVYYALVWKELLPIKGRINAPIGRHQTNRLKMSVRSHAMGREAVTNYRRLESFAGAASLVECRLETGRTHQIRVHMAHMGHPIVGDPLYGLPAQEARSLLRKGGYEEEDVQAISAFPRQALHAGEIRFVHPVTDEEMTFEADLPEDYQTLLNIFESIG